MTVPKLMMESQKSGMGMKLMGISTKELDLLFENLTLDGRYITGIEGVNGEETRDRVLLPMEAWA